MTPSDQRRAAVAGLVALGSAAIAYGKRKQERRSKQPGDCQSEESGDRWTEVPIDG